VNVSKENTDKITEYREQIAALHSISSYEVYRWLISLGKQLKNDPLSETNRTKENRVTQCQSELFVGLEKGRLKAWSNTPITGGYAYILTDIFNNLPKDTSTKSVVKNIEQLGLQNLFSMIRKAGFYQMIEMLQEKSIHSDSVDLKKIK